jgi:hypothetical protein
MNPILFDHLSTWEIAHRWLHRDPDTSDQPPIEVRDLLREITYLQYFHEIPISTDNGVELCNDNNAHKGADLESWSGRHNRLVDGLEQVWKHRIYDRNKLESIHLARHLMPGISQRLKRSVPEFWFTPTECSNFSQIEEELRFDDLTENYLTSDGFPHAMEAKDRPEPSLPEGRIKRIEIDHFWNNLQDKQRSRLLCRHFASKLWEKNPTMTTADIMRHEVLQDWAGGKFYGGKDTIRNWIKDLDPRPPELKRGPSTPAG